MSTLVVPAWRLRWQAPELSLVLGERAVALAAARGDEADRLRAEALVVFASNRIGRGVRIADRALDALKAAEAAAEHQTAGLLRVELAGCARSVGAPLTGFAAVRPVLEAEGVPFALRAAALVEASECIVTVGRGDEPAHALREADRLYAADTTLDPNTALLLRGLLRAVSAAQLRRWGDLSASIGAAREGLELLEQADPAADSGQARGRLTLELVCALMDANKLAEASDAGSPLLERPVRAPSASTLGWLRLALATRVHLPAGRIALAREMLRDAVASAERHQLDTLLAESLLALAHVHEVSGELVDALTNLRAAHAAERRRARAVYTVRARLAAEFSGVHREPASLHQQLADLLRADGGPPRPDPTLPAELKQQLRQWRPVQVRKGDSLKVKRVRRAAEDMTVEGLSAARAHAADRWRMVQPFGEPEDKAPDPVDQQPSDRTVPAAGLIASAGAMISGRRRAAREAAAEFEEETAEQQVQQAPAQPESVLDMLKAAGLRQGGRRRAPDPDDENEAQQAQQQWRVEAPAHLRSHAEPEPLVPEPPAAEALPHNFFEPTTAAQPVVGPDGLPTRPSRTSFTAAYGQEPAEPHIDTPPRPSGLAAAFGRQPGVAPEIPEPPTALEHQPGDSPFGMPVESTPQAPDPAAHRPTGLTAAFGRPPEEPRPDAQLSFGTQAVEPSSPQPEPMDWQSSYATSQPDAFPPAFEQPSSFSTPQAEPASTAPQADPFGEPFGVASPQPEPTASQVEPASAAPQTDPFGEPFGTASPRDEVFAEPFAEPWQAEPFLAAPDAGAAEQRAASAPQEPYSADPAPFDAFQVPLPERFSAAQTYQPEPAQPEPAQPEPAQPEPAHPKSEQPEPEQRPFSLAAAFASPESRIPAPYPEREDEEPEPRPKPQPQPQPQPPVPDPVPNEPVPDEVPSVPVPDEVPQPPEPDLLSDSFLSAADVEDDPAPEPRPEPEPEPAKEEPRRKDSELSLAELLAEALVAYETGRREEAVVEVPAQAEDPEKTGPIKPVEPVNPDTETTGPIRRVEESPFGGWTLPGT